VSFADSLNGWIAGKATLIRTQDGGQTWQPNSLARGDQKFYSIHCLNPNTTWLVCRNSDYSNVFRTNDGGATWDSLLGRPLFSISKIFFLKIRALDSLRAWICGSASPVGGGTEVMRTTDGGKSWSRTLSAYSQEGNIFNALSVSSDSAIAALFSYSVLIHTRNGGASWRMDTLAGTFNAISRPMPNYIWLVGDAGNIVQTTNGGLTWSHQQSNVKSDLFSISALDTSNLWAAGDNGLILRTTNGGITWDSLVGPTRVRLNALQMLSKSYGWIVGDSGVVLRYSGGTFTPVQNDRLIREGFNLYQNYPNPFNPTTTIAYSLSSDADVMVSVYTLCGNLLQVLEDTHKRAGLYHFIWTPSVLATGPYFLRLNVGKFYITKKMLLVR
jgi:photosystem II stability/assembly factor-like uncharacterized protein